MLLPYPFAGPFDYRVPPDLHPKPGDIVLVPLNRREEVGVVWDAPADEAVPAHKLKSVVGILDTPPMGESLRRFIDWIAAYTLSPPGEVMAMALRVVSSRRASGRSCAIGAPNRCPRVRLTPPRQRVLDALARQDLGWPPICCGRPASVRRCCGDDRGRAGHREIAAAGRAVSASRSGPPGAGAVGSAAGGRRGAAQGGRRSCFYSNVAGRGHRLRQDRGLSGGRRRLPAGRPPGAGDAAGNRTVLAMDRAVPAPVRRRAGGVALRPAVARAKNHLGGGRRRHRPGRRRRPVGAVPAVPRPRPGRGGRGT